jgi:hypothetical protein
MAGLSTAAHADNVGNSVYGDVEQALVGVKAGLGGSAAADVAYDAAHKDLFTAKVGYTGLLFGSDSLSVGKQATAYGAVLDSQLGASALNCFSCFHAKSAIYSAYGVSVEANEHNNYSGTVAIPVATGLKVAGSVDYDNPTSNWIEKGAILGSYSILSAVLYGSQNNGAWDYGIAGNVALSQWLPNAGLFGKWAKCGAWAAGPTYQATSNLLVSVLAEQVPSADVKGSFLVSASF